MSNDLYRDRDARLDTVAGENKSYFSMISRIMISQQNRDIPFQEWCETEYGFRLAYDEDGHITAQPDIVDPQKYTLCVLKYGG